MEGLIRPIVCKCRQVWLEWSQLLLRTREAEAQRGLSLGSFRHETIIG